MLAPDRAQRGGFSSQRGTRGGRDGDGGYGRDGGGSGGNGARVYFRGGRGRGVITTNFGFSQQSPRGLQDSAVLRPVPQELRSRNIWEDDDNAEPQHHQDMNSSLSSHSRESYRENHSRNEERRHNLGYDSGRDNRHSGRGGYGRTPMDSGRDRGGHSNDSRGGGRGGYGGNRAHDRDGDGGSLQSDQGGWGAGIDDNIRYQQEYTRRRGRGGRGRGGCSYGSAYRSDASEDSYRERRPNGYGRGNARGNYQDNRQAQRGGSFTPRDNGHRGHGHRDNGHRGHEYSQRGGMGERAQPVGAFGGYGECDSDRSSVYTDTRSPWEDEPRRGEQSMNDDQESTSTTHSGRGRRSVVYDRRANQRESARAVRVEPVITEEERVTHDPFFNAHMGRGRNRGPSHTVYNMRRDPRYSEEARRTNPNGTGYDEIRNPLAEQQQQGQDNRDPFTRLTILERLKLAPSQTNGQNGRNGITPPTTTNHTNGTVDESTQRMSAMTIDDGRRVTPSATNVGSANGDVKKKRNRNRKRNGKEDDEDDDDKEDDTDSESEVESVAVSTISLDISLISYKSDDDSDDGAANNQNVAASSVSSSSRADELANSSSLSSSQPPLPLRSSVVMLDEIVQPGPSSASGAAEVASASQQHAADDVLIPYHTTMHPRLEPAIRSGMQRVNLTTNIFQLALDPMREVFRYDVDVNLIVASDQGRKEISLCRGPRDDGAVAQRHELVRHAVRAALEAYGILSAQGAIVYDDAAILFSNENLAIALKPHSGTVTINVNQLSDRARSLIESDRTIGFEISFQPCEDSASRFTLGDAEKKIKDGDTDRPLRQFLELLTNQDAVANRNYIVYGGGKAFVNGNATNMGRGIERRPGVTKGIRFIEGRADQRSPHGDGPSPLVAALILDAKVGTFFRATSLVDTLLERNRWNSVQSANWDTHALETTGEFVRGLRFEYVNRKGSFIAYSISNVPLNECTENYVDVGDGKEKMMFSMNKYCGEQPSLSNWPSVVQKTKRGLIHHAIEFLKIAEHQRVPLWRQEGAPPRADLPVRRWQDLWNHMDHLNLAKGGNSLMEAFGVRVADRPMTVEGFRRPAPSLTYGKNQKAVIDKEKVNWRTNQSQFECGAVVDSLYITYDNRRVEKSIKEFGAAFLQKAKMKGLQMGKVEYCFVNLENEIREQNGAGLFKKISKEPGNVLIIYIDPREHKTHGYLKLLEARHQVLTQHITQEIVNKCARQPTTMENIMMKFNLKAFGNNYTVTPEEFAHNHWFGNTLVMGYDVAHPTGPSAGDRSLGLANMNPSVVGFSANCLAKRDTFIGDYAFQEPLRERVDAQVLNVRMKWILRLWREHHSGDLPEMIFVFRDGVSEGQYDMVLKDELAAIQEACDEFHAGYRPKFVLVVATKRHNKRFFNTGGDTSRDAKVQNAQALTVVDTDVVRTDVTEMFIQTHTPLQGTAKSTEYQLLASDLPDLTQDTLQPFIIALCFEHQICALPISIPEPVYQADEWAKRGSEVLKAYRDLNFKLARVEGPEKEEKRAVDWTTMTKRLSFMGKKLQTTRINA